MFDKFLLVKMLFIFPATCYIHEFLRHIEYIFQINVSRIKSSSSNLIFCMHCGCIPKF